MTADATLREIFRASQTLRGRDTGVSRRTATLTLRSQACHPQPAIRRLSRGLLREFGLEPAAAPPPEDAA